MLLRQNLICLVFVLVFLPLQLIAEGSGFTWPSKSSGWNGGYGGSPGMPTGWLDCFGKKTEKEKADCFDALNQSNDEKKKKEAEAAAAQAGMKLYGFKFAPITFKDVPEGISGFKLICLIYTGEAQKNPDEALAEMEKLGTYSKDKSALVYSAGVTDAYAGYFEANPVRRISASVQPDDLDAIIAGNTNASPKNWGCGLVMTKKFVMNEQSGKSYSVDAPVGGPDAPTGGSSKIWLTGMMPAQLNNNNTIPVGGDAGAGKQDKSIEVPKGIKFP